MKKYLSIILAVLLTASALTGCAGRANVSGQSMGTNTNALASTPEPEDMPDNSFSKEDYQKLSALQFDDYQHMTVSKFQNKVWMMADTAEYQGCQGHEIGCVEVIPITSRTANGSRCSVGRK